MKQKRAIKNLDWRKYLEDITSYFNELESWVIENNETEIVPISSKSIPKSTPRTKLQLMIKNILVRDGMSMTDLAKKLEIDRAVFTEVVYAKKRSPKAEKIIAAFLGEDANKLFHPLISEKHRILIYNLMKDQGLKLDDLSREVKLNRSDLSSILNGNLRIFSAEDRIAKYFGKKHDDVFPPKEQVYYLLPKTSHFNVPENRPDWRNFFVYLHGYIEGMENIFPPK